MVSIRDLINQSMTPEKRAKAKIDILGFYVGRTISYAVTIPFLTFGVSATAVSILSIIAAFAAAVVFFLAVEVKGFLLGWFLLLVWNILDGVDGNIARYTASASVMGDLWDAAAGYIGVIVYYIGMGLAAWRLPGCLQLSFLEPYYFGIGSITAICWMYPRLIMHKKRAGLGDESVAELYSRADYSFIKIVYFNITSINGLGAVIFLICILIDAVDACLLFYFVVTLSVAFASTMSLLAH